MVLRYWGLPGVRDTDFAVLVDPAAGGIRAGRLFNLATRLRPARAVADADLVLEAVASVRANQRPQLVLADLFTHLGVDA